MTLHGIVRNWGSIIHVTKGGNCCNVGDRSPAIWTSPGKTTLHIVFGDSRNGNWHILETGPLPLGEPVGIRITAEGSSVTAIIGSQTYRLKQPTRRPTGKNYKIYMADPWYEPANADIDDFEYIVDGVPVAIKEGAWRRGKRRHYKKSVVVL